MVATVSALSSASQAASYYEADDYYAEGGLAPSEWFGKGAEQLGLSGEVDREQFRAMLEGRIDGDMMFFARDILISGDTSVIVALRNTLDREEINLLDDIASLGGPFARPVKNVVHVLGRIGARVRGRIQELGQDEGELRLAAECESLRGELEALKVRVAKAELRKRKEGVAA